MTPDQEALCANDHLCPSDQRETGQWKRPSSCGAINTPSRQRRWNEWRPDSEPLSMSRNRPPTSTSRHEPLDRVRLDRLRHQPRTRMGSSPNTPPRRPTRLPAGVTLRTVGATSGRSGAQCRGRPGDPAGSRPPRPARTQRGDGHRRHGDRATASQLRTLDIRAGDTVSTLVAAGLAIAIGLPLLVIAATIWWH